jgi:glucose/arabinose dehydrogenase
MTTDLSSLRINLFPQVNGLTKPVHITNADDGSNRLFVVEQGGNIRIIQNGALLPTPFLNIADRVSTGGEQGLLSMAFPPNYVNKSYFYVDYTDLNGDTVVARYRLSGDRNLADPNSEEVILKIDQPFDNHNGGQLAFGPDGHLYIGMGDGGGANDPLDSAQNPNSLLGKLLRIDVESGGFPYAIPSSNPFLSTNDPNNLYRDEIWASGLRNPWRFSFDRLTGDLYIGDVGQNTSEEINFQSFISNGGENYGWQIFEGFNRSSDQNASNLVFPVLAYDHFSVSASVTGGFTYRGSEESLNGIYFYGDFVDGRLWGLRFNGAAWENALLLDTDYGISTFGEDEIGNLYLADYFSGDVFRITNQPL